MNLIQNNPYRIIGVLANDPARIVHRQNSKISAYAKTEQDTKSEYDFAFLEKISRANLATVEKAFANIQQNQDKINFSLFWFININAFDNTAIEYLKAGEIEKGIEIWKKITDDREVSLNNFSAFNNLGTYKLLSTSDEDIKEGIAAKIKLIESAYFENFVHAIAGEAYVINKKRQSENFIQELLSYFSGKYGNEKLLHLFSKCDDSTIKYISKKLIEEPQHNIEKLIKSTKQKRKENKQNAYQYGKELYINSRKDLLLIKEILKESDLNYKLLVDNVASEILQCSIDYFNNSIEERSSYLPNAMELAKLADSIAVNQITKDRIKDSIDTLEDMKDDELNTAISILSTIKAAYERNKAEILFEAEKQKRNLGFGQSLDWGKINKYIENSVDWNKAIELILETIPREHVNIIKSTEDKKKLDEYKSLVRFLFTKISYFQKTRIQYINFWDKPKGTSGGSTTTSGGSTNKSSSSTNKVIVWIVIIVVIIIIFRACS